MLALVGSGEYLPGMEDVDRELLARLPEPRRVVCLPTAAGSEGKERIQYWSELGVNHFTKLQVPVESLAVIDRESAENQSYAERVASASLVYFSGGKPDYLYNTLQGSLVWKAVESVLAGGGLFAGCSAGAMIVGEKFFAFPGWKGGFNFIPGFTIVPHFDEIPGHIIAPLSLTVPSELTILGIDGYTALVVDDGRMEVLGRGGVTVWTRKSRIRYTQGEIPSFSSAQK